MPPSSRPKVRSRLVASLFCCAASVAALTCGSPRGSLPGDPGTAGSGQTGAAGSSSQGAAGATATGAAGTTGTAGTTAGAAGTTAGAAGTTAGAAGTTAGGAGTIAGAAGVDGAAGTSSRVPFKSYEITGTFLAQPMALAQKPGQLKFTKLVIHNQFLAESCSIGDYDKDGVPDVSSGRIWYQGPDFTKSHPFREGHGALPRKGEGPEIDTGVSDDRADFPLDVDGDGWTDIINIASNDGYDVGKIEPTFGKIQVHDTAIWYENPGPALAGNPMWVAHLMHSDVRGEQQGLVDMNGDGFPEIFGACKGCTPATTKGYYQGDPMKPLAAWRYHAVTVPYTFPFGGLGKLHGEGAGDVNGDGRPDLIERGGAWLQASDGTFSQTICTGRNVPTDCGWIRTPFNDDLPDHAGNKGPSHMFVVDMDKDGLTDVVAADWAHGEGLFWYKKSLDFTFTKYRFTGNVSVLPAGSDAAAELAKWGAAFSEPHALQVVDMDGDGRPDVVTGKMHFAQPYGYGDPDPDGTPYLYVFKNVAARDDRTGAPITLQPVQLDPDATPGAVIGAVGTPSGGMGVGRQIAVGHVNTDGILDICVATKVGLAVFLGR